MSIIKSLFSNPPKRGKFIALFGDGSGAVLMQFRPDERPDGIYDAEDDFYNDVDHLIDCGYVEWIKLPDNYVFFSERTAPQKRGADE